jgi:hypothetical protein
MVNDFVPEMSELKSKNDQFDCHLERDALAHRLSRNQNFDAVWIGMRKFTDQIWLSGGSRKLKNRYLEIEDSRSIGLSG